MAKVRTAEKGSSSNGGGEVVNRGAWTAEEDRKLAQYVEAHGPRRWKTTALKAGLNRCGKSCRLRWLNYLRPNIKRGNISEAEEDLILRLHKLLGNRWSLIAGRLPGRTDNEIKNYWNSHLSKKIISSRVVLVDEDRDDIIIHKKKKKKKKNKNVVNNVVDQPEMTNNSITQQLLLAVRSPPTTRTLTSTLQPHHRKDKDNDQDEAKTNNNITTHDHHHHHHDVCFDVNEFLIDFSNELAGPRPTTAQGFEWINKFLQLEDDNHR